MQTLHCKHDICVFFHRRAHFQYEQDWIKNVSFSIHNTRTMAPKGFTLQSDWVFFYRCPIPTGMPMMLLMAKPISPALVKIATIACLTVLPHVHQLNQTLPITMSPAKLICKGPRRIQTSLTKIFLLLLSARMISNTAQKNPRLDCEHPLRHLWFSYALYFIFLFFILYACMVNVVVKTVSN